MFVAAMALTLLLSATTLWPMRSWSVRIGWNVRHLLPVSIRVMPCFASFWALPRICTPVVSAHRHDPGERGDPRHAVDLRPAPRAPSRRPGADWRRCSSAELCLITGELSSCWWFTSETAEMLGSSAPLSGDVRENGRGFRRTFSLGVDRLFRPPLSAICASHPKR